MKNILGVRVAAPVLAVLLGGMAVQGCSSDPTENLGSCEASLEARATAFGEAVDAMTTLSVEMKASLYAACTAINGAPDNKAEPTDAEVTTACDAAATVIGMVAAGATLEFKPANCSVNAQAQLSCEASCDVDAACMPGTVEARCTEGELSVACEGECSGELRCEASAGASVMCEGECSGTCTGTCMGTCNGSCDGTCSAMGADGQCAGTCEGTCGGSCSATCMGSCQGSCVASATAMAECTGEARCKGMCMGTASLPECEANLMPPSCEIDADCSAACEGQASFEAECTPPSVTVTGYADAEVQARIVDNLPAILEVFAKAELAASAAVDIGAQGASLAAEISTAGSCALKLGQDFVAKISAAAEASASVNVSVTASASCTGEASSG